MVLPLSVLVRAALLLALCVTIRVAPAYGTGAPVVRGIERLEEGSWRIAWDSVAGANYRLEASPDLQPGSWTTVATALADGTASSLSELVIEEFEARFWRVVWLSPEGGILVSPIVAYIAPEAPLPQTVFAVTALSDAEVVDVRFYSGGLLRGVAQKRGANWWELAEGYDPENPEVVALYAEARDSLDRVGQSPVARFLLADPERFVPLDAEGNPLLRRFVPLDEDGRMGAFEFRPDGRAAATRQSGLALRFGPGARLVFSGGTYRLQYAGSVAARRGWSDPQPLEAEAAEGWELAVDGVDPAVLGELMGLAEDEPFRLWSHGQAPLLWSGGSLGASGIDGLETEPDWAAVGAAPLPGRPRKASMATDPRTGELVYQVEYYGDFLLPTGLQIRIPRQAPWVFRIYNDWRVTLGGEAELLLPSGGQVSGSVGWRNGVASISLSAHRLSFDALESLVELLPTDPAALVPGAAEDQAMNLAAQGLEAYRLSYRNFVGGAVRIDAVDRERDLAPLPVPGEAAGATLEAWGWRLLAMGSEASGPGLPASAIDVLARLTGNAQDSGQAGYDLPEILAWQNSLARMELAIAAAVAANRAGDIEAVSAVVASAQTTLAQAVEERLRSTPREELVDLLGESARAWLDMASAWQANGVALPANWAAPMERFLRELGSEYLRRLGVEAGEFDPTLNAAILGLDRFSTAAALRTTLDLYALSQYLGLDAAVEEDLLIWEALSQLVVRLADLHELDVGDALGRKAFELAMIVMRQRLELMGEMALLGLDEDFPDFFNNTILIERWEELAEDWLNNPTAERRRDGLLEALRYLSKILAYVPDRAGAYSQSAYEELTALLQKFVAEGSTNPSLGPRDWAEWLEGAVLADGLARRYFSATLTTPREGTDTRSILQFLVDGLVASSGGASGSSIEPQYAFLDQAAGQLLAQIQSLRLEVDAPGLSAAQQAQRRAVRLAYLEALGRAMASYQRVAKRLYEDAANSPGTLAFLGDLLLPGSIRVHELAGAARFRPSTGFVAGRFSGTVSLPKFGARLTVPNASFDTLGNVRLSAFGQASFPGTGQTGQGQVTMRVPQRRPLSIELTSAGRLALSGGADLLLPGGHSVSGFLSIDDPEYVFELAYGGALRFKLLEQATVFRPVLDPNSLPDRDTLAALARVFGSFGAGYDAFLSTVAEADLPSFSDLDPGAPPEFRNPSSSVPIDAWEAWLSAFANEEAIPLFNGTVEGSLDPLRGMLQSAREELQAARAQLAPDLNRLRQLRQRLDAMARSREALDKAADLALIGEEDIAELLAESRRGLEENIRFAEAYVQELPAEVSLPHRLAAIEMAIQSYAEGQAGGVELVAQPDLEVLAGGLDAGAAALLLEAGLNPDGTVADAAKLEALSFRRSMVLASIFLDFQTQQDSLGTQGFTGEGAVIYGDRMIQFFELAIERMEAQRAQANEENDLEGLAVAAAWLLEFNVMAQHPYYLEVSDLADNGDAFEEILAAIEAGYRGTGADAEKRRFALEFLEAGQRNVAAEQRVIAREMSEGLGRTPETEVVLRSNDERHARSGSIFDLFAAHWRILDTNGLLDPGRLAESKLGLRDWLSGVLEDLVAEASKDDGSIDLEFVEANFARLFDTLLFAAEAVAFLESEMPEEAALIGEWRTTWQTLQIQWIGVAQARKAWWYLSNYAEGMAEFSRRYEDGLDAATQAALTAAAGQALVAAQTVLNDMAALFAGLSLEAFDFPLPGDLQVERLFGRLEFNRLLGDWKVAFGGSLRFPDIGLAFSLARAELGSDGGFLLSLFTSGPIPFGLDDDLSLDVANAFSISGNALSGTISNATASGTLERRLEGGGLESYTASIGYAYTSAPPPSSNRGEHRFDFNFGTADQIEVFAEDIVIFRGSVGFSLVVGDDGLPQQGAFEGGAVVGILRKDEVGEGPLTPDDFELRLVGQASVEVDGEETTLSLSGQLYLPEGFQAAACGTVGPLDPAASRATVSIPAGAPLRFTLGEEPIIAAEPPRYTLSSERLGSRALPRNTSSSELSVSGALSVSNVRFAFADFDLLWVDVCSMALEFGYNSATNRLTGRLRDLSATASIPLPDGQRARVGLQVSAWSLDRLPEGGSVFLGEDLVLLSSGGFSLKALGVDVLGNPRTFIGIDGSGAEATLLIGGAFEATTSDWFVDTNGDPVPFAGSADGSIAITLPASGPLGLQHFEFDLDELFFGCPVGEVCEYYFGSDKGLAVTSPRLRVVNPLAALRPSAAEPFILELDMGIKIVPDENYSFSLAANGLELIFDGSPEAPLARFGRFEGCAEYGEDGQGDAPPLFEGLPIFVNKLCLALKNSPGAAPVPLFPQDPGQLPAFSTDNLEITLSAGLRLPAGEDPLIYGEVSDLVVGFVDGVPRPSVDGIGFGVDLTPVLGEELPFAGIVFVGGFQTGAYYFSGKLQANIKGNMVDALVAFDLTGLRGLCIGFGAAEAAIPLAYGFVLTGAKGGMVLGSGYQDPCAFVTTLGINGNTGLPSPSAPALGNLPDPASCGSVLATWEHLRDLRETGSSSDPAAVAQRVAQAEMARRLVSEMGLTGPEAAEIVEELDPNELAELGEFIAEERLDLAGFCPTPGNCPPPTLGFLAEPHPESFVEGSDYEGRAIIKGTSIDEVTLGLWGFNRDFVDNLTPQVEINLPLLAALFAHEVRLGVEAVAPRPPSDLEEVLGFLPDWALELEAEFAEALEINMNALELGFYNAMVCGLELAGIDPQMSRDDVVDGLWELLRETAYAGVPYQDLTIQLSGSFSYTGVSTFASVTAGVMLSTSGASGIVGSLNVFGIPFGQVRGFTTNFDEYGRYSPAFCGELVAAIGPLEIGRGGMLFDCPGCEDRFLGAFPSLANALTAPYAYQRMLETYPEKATPGATTVQLLASLTEPDEKMAYMAAVLNTPPALSGGQLATAFRQFMVDLANSIAPRMAMCAAAQPKLFGFSLNGENTLGSSISYFGPKDPENIDNGATFLVATSTAFSPFQMISQTLLSLTGGGAAGVFVPAIDQANLSSLYEIPLMGTLLNEMLTLPPNAFLDEQFRRYVTSSSNTFEYSLAPLGLDLGRAAGRLVFPSYDYHPARQDGGAKTPPEERGTGLPSRVDLMLATLGDPGEDNLLGDPFWQGTPTQIAELFAETDFAPALAADPVHLVDDYFPHGGLLGAAEFQMPLLLSEGLPPSYFVVINPGSVSVLEWLEAVGEFMTYLGTTERGGDLAFYLPAPNPPSVLAGGFPASPMELLTSFQNFDPIGEFATIYPLEKAFFRGRSDVKLFGLPLASGSLMLVPEDPLFRFEASIAEGSWLDQFFGTAEVEAEFALGPAADAPFETIAAELQEAAADLNDGMSPEQFQAFVGDLGQILGDRLPRANLAANLAVEIPDFLSDFVAAKAGATAELFAFTPMFEPDYNEGIEYPDSYTLARRLGGAGLRGSFSFGFAPAGVFIDIEEASFLALAPSAPGALPRFVGDVSVPNASFGFGGMVFSDLQVGFDTEPGPSGRLASFAGRSTPPDFGPLLQVQAADGATTLGASLVALAGARPDDPPSLSVRFDAARMVFPIFGGLVAEVYGDEPGEPWSFTTTAEPWSATLSLPGELSFYNPVDLLAGAADPDLLLTLAPAEGQSGFLAEIEGFGLEHFTLRVAIPGAVEAHFFPGQPTESVVTMGGSQICLLIDSSGRAYFDLGHRTLPLAGGLLEASGRVEFGVEPLALASDLSVEVEALAFGSVALGGSAARSLLVRNDGDGMVSVDTEIVLGGTVFKAEPARVVLPPGQSRTVTARFTPTALGAANGTLALRRAEDGALVQQVALSGSGSGTPVLHVSDTALQFGVVALGRVEERRVVLTNPGTAPLAVSSSLSGAGFSRAPESFSVPPGGRFELAVRFQPGQAGVLNGTLNLNTLVGNATVSLSGSGQARNWHRQRSGGADLRSIHFRSATDGWAVGDDGAILRTQDGGRVWSEASGVDAGQWRAVAFSASGQRGLLAARNGRVLASGNNGAAWEPVQAREASDPEIIWRAAARRDEQTFALAGEREGGAYIAVELTPGQWSAWSSAAASALRSIAFATENEKDAGLGIAVGPNRTALRTTNGGQTWTLLDFRSFPVDVPETASFRAVASNGNAAAPVFYIVGDDGLILRSDTGGQGWTRMDLPNGASDELRAVRFAPGTDVAYVGGASGVVWRSFDDGSGWAWASDSVDSLGPPINAIATFPTVGGAWAAGENGGIYRRQQALGPWPTVAAEATQFLGLAPGDSGYSTIIVRNPGTATATVSADLPSGPFSVTPSSAVVVSGGAVAFHVVYSPGQVGEVEGRLLTLQSGGSNLAQFELIGHSSPARWTPLPAPTSDDVVGAHLFDEATWVVATTRGIYRTVDGGLNWMESVQGVFTSLAFGDGLVGFAGGGEPGAGAVWRTTNGGATWQPANPAEAIGRVTHLATTALGSETGAILSTEAGGTLPARVAISQDSGSTWILRENPVVSGYAGGSVWRNGNDLYAVHQSTLYVSPNLDRWGPIVSGGPTLRHVSGLPGRTGIVVGDLGSAFLNTSLSTANWTPIESAPLGNHRFGHVADGERMWLIARGVGLGLIYGSDTGGREWALQHVEPSGLGGRELSGIASNLDSGAVLAYGTRGGLWRFEEARDEPMAFLGLPAQIDFGAVAVGTTGVVDLVIQNFGTERAQMFEPAIETEGGVPLPFSVVGEEVILPREAGRFDAIFRPMATGEFRATLRLAGDAMNAEAEIELVGRGVEVPATLIVNTSPPSGSIRIDGAGVSLPAVFRIVDGEPVLGEWAFGSSHTLSASAFIRRDGVEYRFSRWKDRGGDAIQNLVVGPVSETWIAEYHATPAPPPPFQAPPPAPQAPCLDDPPVAGVVSGPWLRVSDGSLALTQLGQDGRMLAQGAMLLSLQRAEASLQTSAVSLREPGSLEIAGLTAGSWRLDLQDGVFALEADNPGLRVFGRQAAPPSRLALLADPANLRFEGSFETQDDLALLPGLFELGPSAASVRFDGLSIPALALDGQARMLRRPNGTWALIRDFAFDSQDGSALSLPNNYTLLDLGLLRLRGDAQTEIGLLRSGQNFTVGVTDLIFDGYGQPASRFSATVSSDGAVESSLDLNADGFRIGPARFVPQEGEPDPFFSWNALSGQLRIALPAADVSFDAIPGGSFTAPGFEIDATSDFEQRFDFPTQFAGFDLSPGAANKNYLILERKDGVPGARLRNEVQGLLGRTTLRLQLTGAASPSLSGTLGWQVEFPAGNTLGSASLVFDSEGKPYEFEARKHLGGVPVQLLFGTGGAAICPLACLPGQDLADCAGACE